MKDRAEAKQYFSLLIKLGVTMVVSIGMGFALGLLLIKYGHVGKAVLIVSLLSGVGLGFYLVVIQIKRVLG